MSNVVYHNGNLAPKKNNQYSVIHLGFIIYTCYSEFGNKYYTIINPRTNTHVHAKSLKIAKNICDIAKCFAESGHIKKTSLDIFERANRLAFRLEKKNAKLRS